MLKFGNKEFRNLQEQVLKNMQNIANIKEGTAVLSEFGIKVVGEVDSIQDLPTVADYKTAHEDWEYGDAFAIGTEPPYKLVILTRANDEITADHWFDIGDFPAPGPQGERGPQGEQGVQGQTGNTGPAGNDAGFGSVLATAQTLSAGSSATATVTASGPNTAKEFSFVFGIPRGADGGSPVWGNIQGTLSDQTDLKNALDGKQATLVSGTNIKTINSQSVVGSGNIEINSGVWGNITGTLSDQTDLVNALAAKQDVIDASHKLPASNVSGLATVATSGSYDDLTNKPTIPAAQVQSDYTQSNSSAVDYIKNKPDLSIYAQSANLATVATSGSYNDLINKPSIPAAQVQSDYTQSDNTQVDYIKNKPDLSVYALSANLATVATSGDYDDLTDKPDLSIYAESSSLGTAAYINENALSIAASQVSGLATVATSGDYDDLIDKPTIGDATISLQLNGNALDSFTANATSNKTINIPNVMTTNTSQSTSNINKIFYDGGEGSVKIMAQRSGTGGTGTAAYLEVSGDDGDWITKISNGGLSIKDHSQHWLKINRNHTITIGTAEGNVNNNTITIPNATGDLMLTTNTQTITGTKTFNSSTNNAKTEVNSIIKVSDTRDIYDNYTKIKPSGVQVCSETGSVTDYQHSLIQWTDDGSNPYTIVFPEKSGTIALTSQLPNLTNYVTTNTAQTITGVKTFDGDKVNDAVIPLKLKYDSNETEFIDIYDYEEDCHTTLDTKATSDVLISLPATSGTLALTSDLTNYLNLTSEQTATGKKILDGTNLAIPHTPLVLKYAGSTSNTQGFVSVYDYSSSHSINFYNGTLSADRDIYFPNKTGTVALMSDLPSVPVTDVTVGGTSVVSSGTAVIPGSLPVEVLTTEPSAAYTGPGLKVVYLSAEPSTKYAGYIYMIAEA